MEMNVAYRHPKDECPMNVPFKSHSHGWNTDQTQKPQIVVSVLSVFHPWLVYCFEKLGGPFRHAPLPQGYSPK
jgi:hypothetical protein